MKIRTTNWIRYLRNFLLNQFTGIKIPYSAQIELTLRCNGNCSFCSIHSLPKDHVKNELSTSQIKEIIDQVAEFGINTLSFTGGEPTLRVDLPELVHYACKKQDLITGIATNGLLMPELLKKGKLNVLDYMLISLDYPNAEKHDNMRGLKIYDKAIETIKLAKKRDIKTIISTVVMKDNLSQLDEICALAGNQGCSIELYPCENIIRDFGKNIYQVNAIQELIPDLSQWAKKIRSLKLKYNNILTDPVSIDIIEKGGFGGNCNPYQQILRCHVAETLLFIRYDGFVDFPCKIHPLISFDIFKHPLTEIYNIQEVREIMKKHDDFDFCDGCRLGCAIVSSMAVRWKTLYMKYIKPAISGQL